MTCMHAEPALGISNACMGLLSPPQGDGHDDLLQGRVAGPLANPINGGLNLPCTCQCARQAVGSSQAQVVLAVGGDNDALGARSVLDDIGDEAPELVWQVPAGGVGDVERGGASLDDLAQDLSERQSGDDDAIVRSQQTSHCQPAYLIQELGV